MDVDDGENEPRLEAPQPMDQPTKCNDTNLGNNTNFAMSMISSEHGNSDEKPHAVPTESNTMDFFMLQNLAISDSEEIISQIYDRKEAFMHLLQSPIQSLDVFALVMEVLAKVCQSSLDQKKLAILLDVCNSPFILSLRNYMVDLPYPELKSANDIYWHNPDDFWANFLTFCECIITLSPPTVLEKCRPLIDVTTQLCLDELAKRHEYTLPENCELILIKSREALIKHEKEKDEKPHDDPKNPNTMDYVTMQNLAKSESEEIISQIYDRKEAFMQLLRSPIQSLDVFAFVMEVLAKVCQSSYNKTKLTILLDVCNSPFILSLRNYMAGLPYPELKSANDIYWHNPDDFWANFLTFCECIITLSPPTVLAKCRRLIDVTTQLCLQELAKRHGYILPENCELILIKSREALMKHEKEKDETPHDGLKKPNTMDSLMLQNLAKSESEEIISQIYDNKEAFMHLLRSPIQSLDVFALVMKLLAKVCQSSFDQKKLTILLDVCNSPFILSLRNYMADLPYPELKSANDIYWQNPDEFWGNFLTFCECIITLSPSIALAKCRTLIDATARLCLDELAGKHDYKLPENFESILIKSREALAKHEKEKIEIEERHNIRHGEDEESGPPENFRNLSVMPTAFDFDEEEGTPYLRANIVKGGYRDVEHYLDVQFRLFREDCFGPLREGIHQFKKDPKKSKYDSVRVYRNVKFVRSYSSSLKVGVVVELDETTKRSFKNVDWANSKRFIFGSLVMFTRGNRKYCLQAATIIDRDVKLLCKGQIPVAMCGGGYDFIRNGPFTMIESEIYFEPYYHVLTAMREPSFPQQIVMKKYIIDVNPESEPPAYLGKNSSYIVKTSESRKRFKVLDFDTWPSSEELNLNESQYEAYRMALTHEFAVIQGPPGTGKTYLGVKVAETLIKNAYGRLLIVCYTNHALDQFLEAILSITDSIVRIGGQSHNEALEEINLNTLRTKERKEAREERRKPTLIQQVFFERRQTLRSCINKLDDHNKLIEILDTYVISYNDLKRYEPKIPDLRKFYSRSNGIFTDPLHLWLFEHVDYDLNEPVTLENEDIGNADNNTNESDDYLETTEELQYALYYKTIKRRSIIRFEEMKSQYQQGVKVSNQTNMQTDIDPTSISPVDRWMLYFMWTENIADRVRARASRLQDEVHIANYEYEEYRMRVDCQLLSRFKVIGMTTSGAARMRKLIETLAPRIVIVEEAAEVLEQHIITALTKSCQHLILIGDHQQLRPSASNIKLARHYNIEVSLFERMVMNGVPSRRLSVQHRMRPEIAALISPAIYPDLQNHPSVSEFPDVRGVTCSVFFFTHNYKEEVVYDGASKTNEKEGDMVLGLANYLVQQEYQPEDVTILAAYSGQMFYMKKQQFKYSHLSDVRITVLDNYQGEESKIILLSLVRNNDENKIGFLSADNRVCVALSRAKQGFYMFGNIEILKSKSPLWIKVAATLESFGSLGTSIRLMCPNHDQISVISTPQDFIRKVPEGGCLQKCDNNLSCLHACPLPCHGYDQEHKSIKCTLKCERILCELNHVCPLMCMDECMPCNKRVMKRLACGHDMLVPCHVAPDDPDVQCLARVPAKLPSCGHEVKKPCYMAPEKVKCPVPCKNVIEKCGHMCTLTCHVEDDPSHEQYLCKKPCTKAKSGCTMELEGDRGAHQCVKMCHEECDECEVEVVKKRNACKHKETVACSKSPDEKPCIRNCARVLACGHFCKLKCYEPCGNCKQLVKKQIPECGHEISLECSVEPERESCEKACERTMPCGHRCRGRCGDPCVPTACGETVQCASPCGHPVQLPCNDYVASGADVNPKVLLQRCTAPCETELACGHACAGSCARCRQGRLHAPCVQPCRQLGLCGHRCPAPCNQVCPPCDQPCGAKCPHSRCPRPGGAPFEPCQEACSSACPHGACARRCGEQCSREACARPCARALRCGHPCRGLCGERCPDACEPCQDDTRFIVLEDCGHIMEFENMEKLMKEYHSLVAMRSCPYCRKRIINTPRYIDLVNSMLAKEINTNDERIIARRRELQEIVEIFHDIHSSIYTDELYPHWKEAFDQIIPAVKSEGKYSLLQLEIYFIYLNILELLSDVYKKYTTENLTELQDSLIDQNKMICEELVKNVHNISQQQQSDIENEIERMYAIVHLAMILSHPSYVENKSVPEVKDTVDAAKIVIFKSGLYDHDKATEALNAIQKAINVSGIVTKMERLNIKAIGAKAGQWFKCPKGHFYSVERCDGDNKQVSRCVECIAKIEEEA